FDRSTRGTGGVTGAAASVFLRLEIHARRPDAAFPHIGQGFDTRSRPACPNRDLFAPASQSLYIRSGGRRNRCRNTITVSNGMLNEVYNKRIIELAGNIPRVGRLGDPDATATAHSKLCGSTVTVDLKMSGDEVTDFAHDVRACALGQASSSIMARNV